MWEMAPFVIFSFVPLLLAAYAIGGVGWIAAISRGELMLVALGVSGPAYLNLVRVPPIRYPRFWGMNLVLGLCLVVAGVFLYADTNQTVTRQLAETKQDVVLQTLTGKDVAIRSYALSAATLAFIFSSVALAHAERRAIP